jgi:hypothetical protein
MPRMTFAGSPATGSPMQPASASPTPTARLDPARPRAHAGRVENI